MGLLCTDVIETTGDGGMRDGPGTAPVSILQTMPTRQECLVSGESSAALQTSVDVLRNPPTILGNDIASHTRRQRLHLCLLSDAAVRVVMS